MHSPALKKIIISYIVRKEHLLVYLRSQRARTKSRVPKQNEYMNTHLQCNTNKLRWSSGEYNNPHWHMTAQDRLLLIIYTSFAFSSQRSRIEPSNSQLPKQRPPSWLILLQGTGCPPPTLLPGIRLSPLLHYYTHPFNNLNETDIKPRAGVRNMLLSSPLSELLAPPITQFGRSILILASHTSCILEKGGHFRLFWWTIT